MSLVTTIGLLPLCSENGVYTHTHTYFYRYYLLNRNTKIKGKYSNNNNNNENSVVKKAGEKYKNAKNLFQFSFKQEDY